MVALTHNTARQLGYVLSAEDAARPFVEVSGRKGLGVKADDLLDVLIRKAGEEVAKRNADLRPPMPPGRSRKRLPSRPSATSWSASREERSSRSTSTKR